MDCPQALSLTATFEPKTLVSLYVEGGLGMQQKSSKKFVAPEAELINSCSKRLAAKTFTGPLPERLNIFAYRPREQRNGAFIHVSSVDQKMAMEKKGPFWHAYVADFPDLRFVGSTVRIAQGLVTLDKHIKTAKALVGKRIGLVMRPSSLRVLQEAVLINSWGIYDQITVKEYPPGNMSGALDRGEVDVIFMPVIREDKGNLLSINLDINRTDIHWISISSKDVASATESTSILAEQLILPRSAATVTGEGDVGLITFDVAWFTFASTPDDVVYAFLQTVRHFCSPNGRECSVIPADRLLRWPQLETGLIHPGAQKFYKEMEASFYP